VAVTFYALNVYPENIKAGLEDDRISKYVTGKFIAFSKNTNRQRGQKLIIKIELKRGIELSRSVRELIKLSIFENLMKLNAEYRKLHNSLGRKAFPVIELVHFGNPAFKILKSKHAWFKQKRIIS